MDRLPLVVRRIGDADRPRWDAFVQGESAGTFFHLSGWEPILREVFRHRTHYLYAERGKTIVGVLPLVQVKSWLFGHSLCSLPFCAYGGIVGDAAAVAALEKEADALALALGVQYLEYRNLARRHADWPRQNIYVTFRKAIGSDDDANLLAIPRKQRAMVRKGISNRLQSVLDSDFERFFPLYAENVRHHGTPALPKAFFDRLSAEFGSACSVLTVIDAGGRALSSVLSFRFRNEILPYYAGDLAAARTLAANDFKYWELMRRAAAEGVRLFDFGRSKLGTGPCSFKKNWGFAPQPLAYEYRLYKREAVPQNNPTNPKYRPLIALWRRLPLQVANALGPHIVRNLG